jgi:hypothetical protein
LNYKNLKEPPVLKRCNRSLKKTHKFLGYCPLSADRSAKDKRAPNNLKMLQAQFFGSGINWVSGSGSRQAKTVSQRKEKLRNLMFKKPKVPCRGLRRQM